MTIQRYGIGDSKGPAGKMLPFAQATKADGWLYVSGQIAMDNGEIIDGGIVVQSHRAIKNMINILEEVGYSTADIVRIGVWLDDPRDFGSFNEVFATYFGDSPPARACVQASMVVDCKIELDCIAYKSQANIENG